MLTFIGCGNLNRSDDAVGVRVVQRLAERLRRHPVAGVRAFDCGTAGMEVMFKARGSSALIIVDACSSGSEPGAIFDVPGDELEAVHEASYSLHDFRWNHAIAAGRKIFADSFPADVRVWLVEAESLDLGLEMSQAVQAAADTLYNRALDVVAEHAARHPAEQAPPEVEVVGGSIRIDASTYASFFGRRQAALFMVKEQRLLLIPVDALDGGVLIKQRNATGDRTVDAREFLRAHGLDDLGRHRCPASWNADLGALVIDVPPLGGPV